MTDKLKDCGSPSCLLDGLKEAIDNQGKALKEQHQESREFMRELMMTHVGHLTAELAKTNVALGKHAETLYPMVRDARERMTKIEIEIGPEGLGVKLAKAVGSHETVKWVARRRAFESRVAIGVLVLAVFAVIGTGISMFVDYQAAKQNATASLQNGKP